MSFWSKIFGGPGKAERVDYYEEGVALAKEGNFNESLTSLRLALKESPGDPIVLQQIAICYTRMGMEEEAIKTYRHVLDRNPNSPGAHYGLAFLLLRRGSRGAAIDHLEAFLAGSPTEVEARDHVSHAQRTLQELRRGTDLHPKGEA